MTEPTRDVPHMPTYGLTGTALLEWEWARERLERSRNYWLATTRADGSPHLMKVWGIWCDERFEFSTDMHSLKARNLTARPTCSVSTEDRDDLVVVEGVAAIMPTNDVDAFLARYNDKYRRLDPSAPPLTNDWGPFWVVQPRRAFGCIEAENSFVTTMTRWRFAP